MSLTIYHNPRCSKSRKTLQLIQSKGISPTIIPYLESPPDCENLLRASRLLGVPLRDILRRNEDDFKNAGNSVPVNDENALAAWLHQNPRVLQRPIVIDEKHERAIIGRPPENVLQLLWMKY